MAAPGDQGAPRPDLLQETFAWLRSQPPTRILFVVVAALATAGGIYALTQWNDERGFRLLQADLTLGDSARVVAHLDKLNIPYRIADDGHSLLVPEGSVAAARMQLAEQGLGSGTIPISEIASQFSPGMSATAQELTRRLVLERELAQSIESLALVNAARVHLAPLEDSVFLAERRPAKASVVLELLAAAKGEPVPAAGIARLVAHAVEGLEISDVTIVDTGGRVHWPSEGAWPGGTSTDDFKSGTERDLAEKATAMLAAVVGPDHVRVEVSVEVDHDRHVVESTSYEPEGIVRSEQQSGTQGGRTINYEIAGKVERREATAPRVLRVTLAAFVAHPDGGTWGDGELERFEQILRDAVGYDESRGDRVTVASATFRRVEPPPAPEATPVAAAPVLSTPVIGGAAGGAALLALVAFVLGRRRRSAPVAAAATPVQAVVTARSPTQQLLVETARSNPEAMQRMLASWNQGER